MHLDAALVALSVAAPTTGASVDALAHDAEAVARSVDYLSSPAALASLEVDSYWPKWDSPWWHMLLLHERGQSSLVPKAAVTAMVAALERLPLKIFPIHPGDVPAGVDVYRDSSCHCALGSIVPVLLACGVDVDRELPWARDWFGRYQMSDGGLNCDPDAYLAEGEVPSSMVGTVAPLEAMLALTRENPRPEDLAVLDRAASFLVARRLSRGSESVQNASERDSARAWSELTFPRFYFYDVLRGLSALLAWATRRRRTLAWSSIADVVVALLARFSDSDGRGGVRIGRRAFEGARTRLCSVSGQWTSGHPESSFPLLEASSQLDGVSPFLTAEWRVARETLLALHRDGLLTGE